VFAGWINSPLRFDALAVAGNGVPALASARERPGECGLGRLKKRTMPDRFVHCRLLKKDLPGLERPPFRNVLGQRIYEEVSKEGWQQWVKDSVRYINTYRLDLATPEGQKFMLKQCAIYFGYEEGDKAETAWVPPEEKK